VSERVALGRADSGSRSSRRMTVGLVWIGSRFHDLRHYYASLLIRYGESVKVVQSRLGHASAAETLDTYSHLWPDSEERTRQAVQEALSGPVAGTVSIGGVRT
jgi:integrase